MTSDSESDVSANKSPAGEPRGGLLRVGAIAVTSALLGGIAVAWWYRKTLQKLHETGENSNNPHFGIASEGFVEDTTDDI
jgi:hypothetical protein